MHERNALLQQPPGEQAVAAEIILAVPLEILGGFLGHVEHVALLHQLMRLLERIRERLGNCRAAAAQELFIDMAAEILPRRLGRGREILGQRRILRRVAVAQLNA